ncbi:MAG: hypothetical protein KGZ71_05960 [Desulfobulbaceae bacterium]|nr:hypothetical protein [Candidatus Kapabacteria bacterium]MBS4000007.1 hypothetical protein [Desulfobulbaceae bacterium]
MERFNLYILGIVTAFFLHMIIGGSCFEQEPTKPDDNSADVKKINESAQQIEEIFVNADTSALKSILTDAALPQYGVYLPQIITVMNDFGTAIKSRKLIAATQHYAEFSYTAEGKEYSFALAQQDDGTWKLMRF